MNLADKPGKKWALLVGVGKYERPGIPELSCTVNDATQLAKSLQNQAGFAPENMILMTSEAADSSLRPTHNEVIGALENFVEGIKPEDTFLFFFSGHGFMRREDKEEHFLATVNADPRSLNTLRVTSLPVSLLRESMERIRARQIILLIDACRDVPEASKRIQDARMSPDFSESLISAAKSFSSNSQSRDRGRALLMACSEQEKSWEWREEKLSVFTYYLLKGLKGEAFERETGNLTMTSLARYTRREVIGWCDRHNKEEGDRQTPDLHHFGNPDIILARKASEERAKPDDEQRRVVPRPLPNSVAFEVVSEPAGASVYVDGQYMGVTPLTLKESLSIKPRSVEIVLELPEHEMQAFTLDLERGRAVVLETFVLEKRLIAPLSPVVVKELPQKQKPAERKEPRIDTALKAIINPKDHAEAILIPAGEFLMGSTEKEIEAFVTSDNSHYTHYYKRGYKREWFADELPQHKVVLDAFCIYKYPVMVGQYLTFCKDTKCKQPDPPFFNAKWKKKDHPIVGVSWFDAQAYCAWAGGQLPTEAQWEKAARGPTGFIYPWGNEWDSAQCVNSVGSNNPGGTLAVGQYAPNGFGLYDMAGNVLEWCQDTYEKGFYKDSPLENPKNLKKSGDPVLRGGSWHARDADDLRVARRYSTLPANTFDNYGFRCVLPG